MPNIKRKPLQQYEGQKRYGLPGYGTGGPITSGGGPQFGERPQTRQSSGAQQGGYDYSTQHSGQQDAWRKGTTGGMPPSTPTMRWNPVTQRYHPQIPESLAMDRPKSQLGVDIGGRRLERRPTTVTATSRLIGEIPQMADIPFDEAFAAEERRKYKGAPLRAARHAFGRMAAGLDPTSPASAWAYEKLLGEHGRNISAISQAAYQAGTGTAERKQARELSIASQNLQAKLAGMGREQVTKTTYGEERGEKPFGVGEYDPWTKRYYAW